MTNENTKTNLATKLGIGLEIEANNAERDALITRTRLFLEVLGVDMTMGHRVKEELTKDAKCRIREAYIEAFESLTEDLRVYVTKRLDAVL